MNTRDIERRLAELERRLPRGPMVTTSSFAPSEIRPFQVGFPVELTSTYDTATGYDWKQLHLDTADSSTPSVTEDTNPPTGHLAFTVDNNEDLAVGTRGWLEADPQSRGYLFTPHLAYRVTCDEGNLVWQRSLDGGATWGTVEELDVACGDPGSTVSGPGWIFGLSFDRCLTLTVLSTSGACTGVSSGQEILLIGDAVDSWNSGVGDDFTYDTGSGPVELTRSAGMPHLTIDGIELGYDGSGTDADGFRYLDFVGAGSDFCDGTDPTGECDLSYVKVRVTCSECPDACCPEVAAPDEIHLTLTSVECPAFDRVVTLTRVFSYWYAGKVWYAPVAGVAGKWWQVQCNEGAADYELLITNTDPSGVDVPSLCASALVLTTDTCSPLHLTATALHTGFNPLVTCLGLSCPNPSNLAFDIVE